MKKIVAIIIFLVAYTGLLIGVCFIYIGIKDTNMLNSADNKIDENNERFQKKKIDALDKIIAYGPSNATNSGNAIHYKELEQSKIIANDDLSQIKAWLSRDNNFDLYKKVYTFQLYFGIKDETDYIYITISENENVSFLFQSDLEYTFKSIVDEFYSKYNVIVAESELTKAQYDSANNLETGIIINYIKYQDSIYISYLYQTEGKAYVVNH